MYYYTPTIAAFLQGFTSFTSDVRTLDFKETHVESTEPLEINWDSATEEQIEKRDELLNRRKF